MRHPKPQVIRATVVPTAAPRPTELPAVQAPIRRRLSDTRQSVTRKIKIHHADGVLKVYASVGLYEDGRAGELFLKADRMGTTISGLLDGVAICASLALQYGVPVEALVMKLKGSHFEPYGQTGDPELRYAASILDVVARWLEIRFVRKDS